MFNLQLFKEEPERPEIRDREKGRKTLKIRASHGGISL